MKTPYAILIGLALIAAALFFRQPSVAPAQAGLIGGVDGFECVASGCAVLHGDKITFIPYARLHRKFVESQKYLDKGKWAGIITPWR